MEIITGYNTGGDCFAISEPPYSQRWRINVPIKILILVFKVMQLALASELNQMMENYMFFQLKVRLNIRISLTGKNHLSVTFSENRKSMMSFHRDFPVE